MSAETILYLVLAVIGTFLTILYQPYLKWGKKRNSKWAFTGGNGNMCGEGIDNLVALITILYVVYWFIAICAIVYTWKNGIGWEIFPIVLLVLFLSWRVLPLNTFVTWDKEMQELAGNADKYLTKYLPAVAVTYLWGITIFLLLTK